MPHIRKYENRRLYDTAASRYVNLDEIAEMVRRGEEVTVEDSKTGRDLTQEVLLQVVLASPAGAALVPVGLLRRLIRAAASPALARGIDPALAQGLDLFHRQLEAMERGIPGFAGWPVPGAASPGEGRRGADRHEPP
ncbi:MAG: polyhydroxyalkanoate synthesis regulator DNA-binding domain-containing protein, partial [Deltaproteobacteria bacterium]|nr:polyhydroxyalkanoate synthesis regulator DNA-binding domain-containing protein [Deltaproteobacteria bacterium]